MGSEKVGPFIRQLRKDRHMTQKELAAALNVTDKAVSKWERDISLPDVALLLPLAEILGVSVTELLGGARVFRLGLPIAPAAALYLWGLYAACKKLRHRAWLAAGAALALTALLSFFINGVVNALSGGNGGYGEGLFTLALAAVCLAADPLRRDRGEG